MGHPLRGWVAALALLLGVPAAAATTPSTGVPACALGDVPDTLRTFPPAAIARERDGFASSLRDLSGADRTRALADFSTAVTAYLYGMPTIAVRQTVKRWPENT